jgi:5-bromo-4-chloroindolyl phosphate hydrolysis protein
MEPKTMQNMLANVYSALIGGGVFVATNFVLQIGLLPAAICAAAGYAAAIFLVFPTKTEKKAPELADVVRDVLKEGERQLKLMRALAYKVSNNAMRLKIEEMCSIGGQIFATVQKKPQNVRAVQQFSAYYLETTINILTKYIDLSGNKSYSPQIQATVQKVEATLDNVQRAFEKELESLVRDEMLDLDTDMAILKETLELEGLEAPYEK